MPRKISYISRRKTRYEVWEKYFTDKKYLGAFFGHSTLQAFKAWADNNYVGTPLRRVSTEEGRPLKRTFIIFHKVTAGIYAGDERGHEFALEVRENEIVYAKYEW